MLRYGSEGVRALENLPVILVAEDDQLIQRLIEETLSEAGFELALTSSGEEAAALLAAHKGKYRAIVTDINLVGKLDGWEVARHAREIDPMFPVVYISGSHAEDWALRAFLTASYLLSPSRRCSL
jgi:CheY-like chemotaxis protein